MNTPPATPSPSATQPQNPPDPKTSAAFHVRAGQSVDELRKTVLTLSVGAVGFFFVALTGEKAPAPLGCAWLAVLIGLTAFAMAIACALFAWYYAGRDFYDKAIQGASHKGDDHGGKKFCDCALPIFFGLGVAASYVYFIIRINMKP